MRITLRFWETIAAHRFPSKSDFTTLRHVGASFISLAPAFLQKRRSALIPLLLLSPRKLKGAFAGAPFEHTFKRSASKVFAPAKNPPISSEIGGFLLVLFTFSYGSNLGQPVLTQI